MANAFFSLNVLAGSGIGVVTDISSLKNLRTILCIGPVSGLLFVEVAMVNTASAFAPIAQFDGVVPTGRIKNVKGTFRYARTRRIAASSDLPVVTLGGEK